MGRPVVHWELMSKDPAKVAAFYEKIFGWKIQHIPEMDYRLVETGGSGGINGGILKPPRPEPWPGNMTFYIDVDDLATYRYGQKRDHQARLNHALDPNAGRESKHSS